MGIFERELKVVEGALTIARTAMGRGSNARQRFIDIWLDTDEAKEIGQDPSMRYDFAGMAGLTAKEFVDWSRRVNDVDYVFVFEPQLQEIKDRLLQIKKEFSYSGVKELQAENAVLREKSDKVLDWGEVIDNAECGYCEGRVSDCLFCGGDYKDADDLRTTRGRSPLADYTIEGVDRLKVENTELRKKAELLDMIEPHLVNMGIDLLQWEGVIVSPASGFGKALKFFLDKAANDES